MLKCDDMRGVSDRPSDPAANGDPKKDHLERKLIVKSCRYNPVASIVLNHTKGGWWRGKTQQPKEIHDCIPVKSSTLITVGSVLLNHAKEGRWRDDNTAPKGNPRIE